MKNYLFISLMLAINIATPMRAMHSAPEKKYALPNQAELDRQLMDAIGDYEIDPKKIEPLLKAGANPNGGQFHPYEINPLSAMGQKRETDDNIAICKLFLDYGANVDGLDNNAKSTPLISAAHNGRATIARLLVEHKANPNFHHKLSGFTPIHYACSSWGKAEMVQMLIEHKANVNDQSNERKISPLMWAAMPHLSRPSLETCKLLLASQANTMAVCKDGDTSFICAARKQNESVCKLLVNTAKNPSILAFLGCLKHIDRTPLGHLEGIKNLYRGRDILFRAHIQNYKPIELLRIKNNAGKTAYDFMKVEYLNYEK